MATRITRTLVDDIDESTDNVDTYHFSLQGVDYEIDLSSPHFDALSAALNPFITAGRRHPRKTTGAARRAGAGHSDAAKIRAWWASNAATLNLPAHRRRGAIPLEVTTAYQAAH